jgi:hypothetical protein
MATKAAAGSPAVQACEAGALLQRHAGRDVDGLCGAGQHRQPLSRHLQRSTYRGHSCWCVIGSAAQNLKRTALSYSWQYRLRTKMLQKSAIVSYCT